MRKHDARNIEAIKGSLAKFGQQKPLVVGADGVVIAGNGTLEAARALGWKRIDVVRTKLRGVDAAAYAIADNRASELADWDFEPLAKVLASLRADDVNLNALGWADHELEPLLQAEWSPPAVSELPGADGTARGRPIVLTAEQRVTVDRAIAQVRGDHDDEKLGEGRCVELICKGFLAEE